MTCYNGVDKFDFRKGCAIKYDLNKHGIDVIDPNAGPHLKKYFSYLYFYHRLFLNNISHPKGKIKRNILI